MNIEKHYDADSYNFTTPDSEITWQPWIKKFAFLPTKIRGKERIWLKTYYMRHGRSLYMSCTQRGTLLDALKYN